MDKVDNTVCVKYDDPQEASSSTTILVAVLVPVLFVVLAVTFAWIYTERKRRHADAVWKIDKAELKFYDPPDIAGRGTFGLVVKAEYRGTIVAVKRVIPPKEKGFRGSFLDSYPEPEELESGEWKKEASTAGSTTGSIETSGTGKYPDKEKRRNSLDAIFDDKELESGFISTDLEGGQENKKYTTVRKSSKTHSVLSSVDSAVVVNTGMMSGSSQLRSGSTEPPSKANWKGWFGYNATAKSYEQLKQDFIVEMRILSKLRHPCITTVCSFAY
jgi:hypothetical protein